MSAATLEGYGAVPLSAAMQLLTDASTIAPDEEAMSAIAALLGYEAPALEWAGTLARTMGWRPLRERLHPQRLRITHHPGRGI